ncbi:bifunctional aspartate kinase/homoserine dehydrogenase I [Flavobacterium sp. xlx-214]|uniref:bifunctional aspartate kinase/homoserine dehydrogenase I n=1 Tax=unclassified Flavobacterium TaxID=196869 RepID=UPI0013D57F3D|nr:MULTISPECIES: bifunctional aspartate kinase/homoserine dehydrogenase I [unclassified Flavobacterium]MBA5792907.1 bifunctional aspartate kinase/homoserine dehydrogenase I [Flavobacterium sp. xlx-221]QMI84759.1 bifunctional aspartate kinase/homoserine dehydrogenase I [Flavobacterium sp. xlx-214]
MKIVKFGGKSLAFDGAFHQVVDIIKNKAAKEQLTVVVSAIGNTTDVLENILETAKNSAEYIPLFQKFKQEPQHQTTDLNEEFQLLQKILEGVNLLGDYSLKIKDNVLAQGEIISAKVLTHRLKEENINANFTDSRTIIVTDANFGNAQPIEALSKAKTQQHFSQFNNNVTHIVTGFIGATNNNETTTLGRNGSNYSASLLASYLNAEELQNYTHVDGIFTANPEWVKNAKKIDALHFNEANELANFGASILHAKTIIPLLEQNIPLRILNTFKPNDAGTLISAVPTQEGIKSLSVLSEVALINFEGRGLLGKVGVDARVFNALSEKNISVSVISQGSSERGLGFIVDKNKATQAVIALEQEFENDFYTKDVNRISVNDDIAVISIIGQDLSSFHKPYNALIQNNIVPILFNNTVTGKNVSIVVKKSETKRALNVIHGQIFGVNKKVNIAIVGFGTVGSVLINQIVNSKKQIAKRKNIDLNIFAIANSTSVYFNADGFGEEWKVVATQQNPNGLTSIINFAKDNHLENLILIDNTAATSLPNRYIEFIENGFDVVSSNKIANTLSFDFYKNIRQTLAKNQKEYLYETNVGAGLPLIDTIKLLHLSGENITKIKGVFSGTLSYLFNHFSVEDRPFSEVLKETISKGFTEPDPREDLSGQDVGRKLLILARELELENEFDEIKIQNLIPEAFQSLSVPEFLNQLEGLDAYYQEIKQNLKPNEVLRYIGELSGDLQQNKGVLETKLIAVSANSSLGQLSGSDSIFEIYTESYGNNPIVIQGAGAGAQVTARGVFGDILRLAEKK